MVSLRNNKRQEILAFISDRGRVRTCNHQSRNLIFYPVELRSQFEVQNTKFEVRFNLLRNLYFVLTILY